MQVSSKMDKRAYKIVHDGTVVVSNKGHGAVNVTSAAGEIHIHHPAPQLSKHPRHVQIRQTQHHFHHQTHTPSSPTHTVITTAVGSNRHDNLPKSYGGMNISLVGNSVNNNNNGSKKNTSAAALVDQTVVPANGTLTTRNKNEEAIVDLRQRIPEIESIFDVHGRIGNGTFSTVLLGTLKKERNIPEEMRRKFAIKHHIPTSHPDRIMKELQCMAKMGGTDNVVGINCCIRYNESVAFIMPYLQHDRFHDFYNKMELTELQHYMRNLLVALRHVHKFNVIHRDVKPSNFLYNRQRRQFLLVDFGLAQQVPTPQIQLQQQSTPVAIQTQNGNIKCLTSDGKRVREHDDEASTDMPTAGTVESTAGDNVAKRFRCTGPQGDQQQFPNGQTFKMPLKQWNEIINAKKDGNVSAASSTAQQQGVGNANEQLLSNSNTKYTTNRNLNAAKCYCYGQAQVCNVCLVKKEIHASRAGTPGYRPPEVLLKYPDQTTAVDIWAAGVILLSILSSVYPFFKAPNDYVALAEIVTIFGDKIIRKTGYLLDRLVTLSQKTRPLDLRKLCVRFRNRVKFSSQDMLRKYQCADGSCEVCKNCDQYYFNCLCVETMYETEPLDDVDPFPESVYDLLYRLLEVNPHKRITAEEALEHPFFSERLCLENVSDKNANDNNANSNSNSNTTIVPVHKK